MSVVGAAPVPGWRLVFEDFLGVLMFVPDDGSGIVVYATPGWEGSAGICIQVEYANGRIPRWGTDEIPWPGPAGFYAAVRPWLDLAAIAVDTHAWEVP